MRNVLGRGVIALVIFGLGLACWTVGTLEGRVADAHEQLALLQYQQLDATYEDIDQSMGLVTRLPWLTGTVVTDVRAHRAAADYWQARYDAVAPQHDTAGGTIEEEPSVLALAADAAYRAGQREGGDRQTMLRRLEAAIKSYTDVLKKNPGDADAAYNFEYLVRLRDGLSKSRPAAPGKRDDAARVPPKPAGVVMTGDLPDGRTVHGDPGAPPPNTDMTQFKMHIPVRPDERQGGSDAGQ